MFISMRKFKITLISAISGILVLGAALASDAATKKSILFTGTKGGKCGDNMANLLHGKGFNLNNDHHPALSGKPLTWEKAKKYNVIVMTGFGESNADGSLKEKNIKTNETLRTFLKNGGGLLVLGHHGQRKTEMYPQDDFLNPLGLKPIWDEMPVDDVNSRNATVWKIDFSYTDNVKDSPITKDIKALWYPAPKRRIGDQHHSVSFVADDNWNVVVNGKQESRTAFLTGSHTTASIDGKESTFSKSIPLVAMREVGKGRIVYLGISHEYLQGKHAPTVLEGIVGNNGISNKKSDGLKLFENSVKWLAKASDGRSLGGAPMNTTLLLDSNKVNRFCKPFDWNKTVPFPAADYDMPGLIGARTAYSTGKGTPQQWVEAAKAKGYKFIAFLEEFKTLTPEKFDMLKQDCKELTNSEFAAFAGFTIDDEVGNHYYYFGSSFPWPKDKLINKDSRTFRSYDPNLGKDHPHIKGQLNMTVLNFFIGTCIGKLTGGNYLFSKDSAPFSDFFSNWNSMGVVTTKNGHLEEFAFQDYLKIANSGQGPWPLALTFVNSPDEIDNVKWKTVFKSQKPDTGALVHFFNHQKFYPQNPCSLYISNGPAIDNWSFIGSRDYEGFNKGDFVWQNLRWKVNGKVSSDVGLKEVNVYDGVKLFRRFLPAGEEQYEFTLDLTHDKQHYLVLEAVDINGNKAVSREFWDRNHRLEEFMCGDRNNQLTYALNINKDGYKIGQGGNQTLATPYKRIANGGISPSGTFKNSAIMGAPGFDGGAYAEPQFKTKVAIFAKDQGEIKAPTVAESKRLFHTGDVNIGEAVKEHYFTDNIKVANVWHTLWKTTPAEDYSLSFRNHYFQVDPDSPIAVFLKKFKVTLKKDIPNTGLRLGMILPGESKLFAVKTSDQRFYCGRWTENPISNRRTLKAEFGAGSYAAFLASSMGGCAVFPLTDNLNVEMELPQKRPMYFTVPENKFPQKTGESIDIDLLLIGLPRVTKLSKQLPENTNEVIEQFYSDFGLDGGTVNYSLDIDAGKVIDQKYILQVDGADKQCFSAKISGKLISSLPIKVAGLNDRWSAYYYDGRIKKARPVGVFENIAWVTAIVKGQKLFVGHPIISDNNDLIIQVTQAGVNKWSVEVHNPTDEDICATIMPNTFFQPLSSFSGRKVTLTAGRSQILYFE